jgi:hypothetical protein
MTNLLHRSHGQRQRVPQPSPLVPFLIRFNYCSVYHLPTARATMRRPASAAAGCWQLLGKDGLIGPAPAHYEVKRIAYCIFFRPTILRA